MKNIDSEGYVMEKTNFLPAFSDSILNASAKDLTKDIIEEGIDSLLEDEIVRKIPVVKSFLAIKDIYLNFHARSLLKKTLVFLQQLSNGTISKKELEKYRKKMDKKPFFDKELERILLLLDKATEIEKCKIYAMLLKALLDEAISLEEYQEMTEITDRIFLVDFEKLKVIFEKEKITDINYIDYKVDRLTSLGLVKNTFVLSSDVFLVNTEGETEYCSLTTIGKLYAKIIFK